MGDKKFCHLHLHSGYSLLDGSGKIKPLIKRAKELGMESIALTDHGVMYGCVDLYKEAKAEGIKPILGCEVYVVPKSRKIKSNDEDNKTYHLVLLVKNEKGYENLMKIVSVASIEGFYYKPRIDREYLKEHSEGIIAHLVLLVKNEKGYENLMKIVSVASIEGFYYKPRIDREYLKEHSEGIIALSACLGGEVQKAILNGNIDKAREAAIFYRDTFKDGFYLELQNHGIEEQKKVNEVNIQLAKELNIPLVAREAAIFYRDTFKDGFYLELQNHGIEEQKKVNEVNIQLAKELNIPLVATNDVHYINQEDSKAHDILMCIQTGKTVDDPNRRRYPSDQFYLKSPEEMWDMFDYIPEALENTLKIAEECNFDYEFHVSKLPKFPLPEGVEPFEYLRKTCFDGLIDRLEELKPLKEKGIYDIDKVYEIGEFPLPEGVEPFEYLRKTCFDGLIDRLEELKPLKEKGIYDIDKVYEIGENNEKVKEDIERLEYELGVIKQMGYVDYFLIVWDFIKYANDNGIPTGPGRGSAAGALVAYTLGITKIDPMKYSLLFERFLNPERVSMPDIDSDFCYEGRQRVIDYVVEKYGHDNVSQIITFGTMAKA